MSIQNFIDGYITCALWSSVDDKDEPMDSNHSASDISTEAYEQMEIDCRKFYADNNLSEISEQSDERMGHDFWLTRNGHGAGFWDGDYSKEIGDKLTEASKSFGECTLYIGDDGKLYIN